MRAHRPLQVLLAATAGLLFGACAAAAPVVEPAPSRKPQRTVRCDGKDDSEAIAAAIADARVVTLEPGVCRLAKPVRLAEGTTLRGAGRAATELRPIPGATWPAIFAQDVSGWNVEDLAIAGSKRPAGAIEGSCPPALQVRATSAAGVMGARIARVAVRGACASGIDVAALDAGGGRELPLELAVEDAEVRDAGRVGILVNRATALTIQRCVVRGSGAEGIYVNRSRRFAILDSEASTNGWHGIVAGPYCSEFRIAGNTSIGNDVARRHGGNSGIGVVVSEGGTRFIVANNRCDGNGGMGISIDVKGPTTQLFRVDGVVAGNVISNSRTAHGIYAQYLEDLAITGNVSTGNAGAGIFVVAARNVAVTGNVVRDNGTYGVGFSEPTVEFDGFAVPSGPHVATGNVSSGNARGDVAEVRKLSHGPVRTDLAPPGGR